MIGSSGVGDAQSASDARIVAESRLDPELFGLIFERHATAVHGFLARRAGREAADELLGEVFATAFAVRLRFDAHYDSSLPWLYGIARNLLGARARSTRRRLAAAVRLAADPTDVDRWPEVDDRLDARARVVDARALMNSLPPGEREVVELVAWEGLSLAEAAVVLGIPAGTARSRLHRARQALRPALTPGRRPGGPLVTEVGS